MLQLTEGYRIARRTTSLVCMIAIAWSTAQFEIRTVNAGFLNNLELTNDSIPIILISVVAYVCIRFIIEFCMQPLEVRRWKAAQIDFKLSIALVQLTIVLLSASGLRRSVSTILYLALGTLILLIFSLMVLIIFMVLVSFLRAWFMNPDGKSALSNVFKSFAWAEAISVFCLVALLICLAYASLRFEPLLSLWESTPSPLALYSFLAGYIVVALSVYSEPIWLSSLFKSEPRYLEQKLLDGTIERKYR